MRMMTRALVPLLLLSLPALAQDEAKPLDLSRVPLEGQAPQDFVPSGWKAEATVRGDLDKKGGEDVVLQLLEEGPETNADGSMPERSRALVILLAEGGKFRRAGASNKVLLCTACSGMMGGTTEAARVKIQKGVVIVDEYSGSRESTATTLRFRYEPKDQRFALIGADVTHADRLTGKGEKTSTNLLTGQRITEKLQYDAKKEKDVVVSSKKDKVAVKRSFLEDVDITSY